MKRNPLLPALLCLLLFTAGACSSARKQAKPKQQYEAVHGKKPRGSHPGKDTKPRKDKKARRGSADAVVREARSWLGVPYRYGGNDRAGVDCSGLVCRTFVEGAGIKLPRTAAEQQAFCAPIKRNKVRRADLVFFTSAAKGRGRVSHVGIMVDGEAFIHASSSRGVIVSRLDEQYYATHLHSIGRVPGLDGGNTAEEFIIEELLNSR